ncbi:hypothetical protein Trydic_g4533 [Trypoxylus dichotomus]
MLVNPLSRFFTLALKTSLFPDKWKIARTVPIFKADEPFDISSYRPIWFLSNFTKTYVVRSFGSSFTAVYITAHAQEIGVLDTSFCAGN